MDANALEVLCGGYWEYPLSIGCSIKFNKDGTGQITCGIELVTLIAAELEWEFQPDAQRPDAAPLDASSDFQVSIPMQITLTKRRIQKFGETSTAGWRLHDENLLEPAFRSRKYTLTLSTGRFNHEVVLRDGTAWYARRLQFDVSPYPPLEEWADVARRPAENIKFWERREFFGDLHLPELSAEEKERQARRRQELREKLGIGKGTKVYRPAEGGSS